MKGHYQPLFSPPLLDSHRAYLQVILSVHVQPVAEHVPHDQQVGVLALHRHSVHAQELREERVAVAGDDVLQDNSG